MVNTQPVRQIAREFVDVGRDALAARCAAGLLSRRKVKNLPHDSNCRGLPRPGLIARSLAPAAERISGRGRYHCRSFCCRRSP